MAENSGGRNALRKFVHGVKTMYREILGQALGFAAFCVLALLVFALPLVVVDWTTGFGSTIEQEIFRAIAGIMLWNILVTIPVSNGISEVFSDESE